MNEPIQRHPLMGIQDERSDFKEMAEASFEEDTVKYLLEALELTKHKFKLLDEWKRETGERRLTLTGFCRHFDSFPLSLRGLTTSISRSDRLHLLFKSFGKGALLQKWKDLRDEESREMRSRSFGVVVKWPYLPRGLVFHTMPHTGIDGLRMVWKDRKFVLTAEPLPQLVEWLKLSWSH